MDEWKGMLRTVLTPAFILFGHHHERELFVFLSAKRLTALKIRWAATLTVLSSREESW
jgi:hypothetical protein